MIAVLLGSVGVSRFKSLRGIVVMKKLAVILTCLTLFISACAPKPAPSISADDSLLRMEPHITVYKPNTLPPYKTVLVFHGAKRGLGWDVRYQSLMNQLKENGYASVFVDMFTSRGTTGNAVFSGELTPKATSGDVMILIEWAKRQNWIDKRNISAVGYSFGAATLMDALTLSKKGRSPEGLLNRPELGASSLRSIVLMAPWCKHDVLGFNIIASTHENFGVRVPVLALIPSEDSISDTKLCQQILERNVAIGHDVNISVLKGSEHKFYFKTDAQGAPELQYDSKNASFAKMKMLSFLKSHWQ